MHACSQSLSPVVDGRVNNALLQTVPDFNDALLQLINTVDTTFIHSLLHNTLDLTIHWIQVCAVWWPETKTIEVPTFLAVGVLGTTRWSVVLLILMLPATNLIPVLLNRNLHAK